MSEQNLENNQETTVNQTTPSDWTVNKEDSNSVPYARFKEVNDNYKEVKAKLEAIEEEKRKQAESEAIAKGEQEKIIAQKNQEIELLKKEKESWTQRENALSERNSVRISELSKKFGENWESVKSLIDDVKDPFILSSKLDSLEKMTTVTTPKQKGGSDVPSWSWKTRKEELMDKVKKGERLTSKERAELYSEVNKN